MPGAMPRTVSLTEAQKRFLRRIAHTRKVIVQTGANGLTAPVLRELGLALDAHELVKARFVSGERSDRDAMIREACARLGAALVQRVGHVAVLWRPNPDKANPIGLP
jgi:RNA-binding protein